MKKGEPFRPKSDQNMSIIKAKVSTDGSDEESLCSRVTLSFLVPSLLLGLPRFYQSGSKTTVKWPCSSDTAGGVTNLARRMALI